MNRLVLEANKLTISYDFGLAGGGALIEPFPPTVEHDEVFIAGTPDQLREVAAGLLQIADDMQEG